MSQEKSKTMPMQIFGGKKRCIMGFVQVVNKRLNTKYTYNVNIIINIHIICYDHPC